MPCDPIPVAELAYDALTDDVDFELPDVSGIVMPTFPEIDASLLETLPSVQVADLTEGKINGSGVFDVIMTSVTAHLERELRAGRITNSEFAKSYVDFSTAAMGNAVQFLLQKDQAHWAAITAQNQAKLVLVELVKAGIDLNTAKLQMQMVAYQAAQVKAQVAMAKMQLATAQVEFCTAEYNLSDILPKQALLLTAQKSQVDAQKLQTDAQTDNIIQTTTTLLPEQVRGATAQADTAVYQLTFMLPAQKDALIEQVKVTKEQHETQRAQTMDTRSDGITPVDGTLGKQKELHSQQITSYQQDAQLKASRIFVDAWITMKTIDEGTLPPVNFNNANLDAVLGVIRTGHNLV